MSSEPARGRRIGFLFNHYSDHQVPHAAPFAFELSRRHPQHEVLIACSTEAELRAAERIAALYPGQRCSIFRLSLPWYVRALDPLARQRKSSRKRLALQHNLDWFRSLDVLVAPERHCTKLRDRFGLTGLALIHTRHGAGDRAGSFDARLGAFELVLTPGRKSAERIRELGLVDPERIAIVGYAKFEAYPAPPGPRPRLFDNDHPTLLYNPHFLAKQSSWQRLGPAVLDFFAGRRDWNVIFAPHVELFRKRRHHGARLPARARRAPNLRIDTGSTASSDLTYTRAADVYLGDVSSQVYEFIAEPRPCIFLDAHRTKWRSDPNYAMWELGDVIERVEDLAPALEAAKERHTRIYASRQRLAVERTFFRDPERSAAETGADAIAALLARLERSRAPADAS